MDVSNRSSILANAKLKSSKNEANSAGLTWHGLSPGKAAIIALIEHGSPLVSSSGIRENVYNGPMPFLATKFWATPTIELESSPPLNMQPAAEMPRKSAVNRLGKNLKKRLSILSVRGVTDFLCRIR